MTIDPKAAELAKALADAVAAQQTEEYQALAEAVEKKAQIDHAADKANQRLLKHYLAEHSTFQQGFGVLGEYAEAALKIDRDTIRSGVVGDTVWESKPPYTEVTTRALYDDEPERYELPEDETQTAKPNGGLSDY